MVDTLKKALLFVIMILMSFGILGNILSFSHLFRPNPLHGTYNPSVKPIFYVNDYFFGSFQNHFYRYLEENVGFHEILVRINNQIAFSLFSMTSASGLVIGRKNYLFADGYIYEYLGRSFQGRDFWDKKLTMIKYIQDTLRKRGVDLIIILEPGKAKYYPEYIPARFKPDLITISNNDYLVQSFKKEKIQFIDFNTFFASIKDTVPVPLYPKCGIHWSAYGAGIAMDSIIRRMEKIKNRKMVRFGWTGFDRPDTLRTPDYDLGELMNLLFWIPTDKMVYPRFTFHEDSGCFKPKVITVADSYYWNLYGPGITSMIYGKEYFWDYFKTVYEPVAKLTVQNNRINMGDEISQGRIKIKKLEPDSILKEIFDSDFILIMATEGNYYRLGFGFFEEVYNQFKKHL